MSLQGCAQAAAAVFPFVTVQTYAGTYSLPVLMVAIAGHESGYQDAAAGDPASSYPGIPECGGMTSFGLWQIHSVHMPAGDDPCAWAASLSAPPTNARYALALIDPSNPYAASNGIGDAWQTTYYGGYWQGHIAQAEAAVAQAVGGSSSSGGTPPGSTGVYQGAVGPPSTGILAAIAAAAAVGLSALSGWPPRVWRR